MEHGKEVYPGPQSDSSRWDRGYDGEFRNGRNGKKSKFSHVIDACTCTHTSVACHCCGCVVNGNVARTAFSVSIFTDHSPPWGLLCAIAGV